ncbi:MAG: nucleotide exchange factor GrpE [Fluviicola sp.]|nr:MAG: nucleotide exchange factor GrpE [Fluviicola sp.]
MSEDKELKNEQDQMDQVNENQEQEAVETETPKEPTFEDKYNELNDKYLRIHAEFDNYRKRTNKEKIDIIGSANAALLKDLLPVMDDFERAMANNENIDDVQGMKEGISLIFNKFKMTLENKGLKPMVVDGEVFDAEIHEAIANIPAPKKKLKGKVVEAVEKGYYLNEKVIRYAKVVVGQ